MKTFDSLSVDEQMVVKCGSVMGDVFSRDMLIYIMGQTSKRGTALGKFEDKSSLILRGISCMLSHPEVVRTPRLDMRTRRFYTRRHLRRLQ